MGSVFAYLVWIRRWCSGWLGVALVVHVADALGGAEVGPGRSQERHQFRNRAVPIGPEQFLELGERQLDRVEVRAVRRQEPQFAPGGFDRRAGVPALVRGPVVQDHDVARSQRRGQAVLDVGDEPVAGHRAVQDARGGQPVGPQRGRERQGFVVPVRDGIDARVAPRGVPVPPGLLGVGERLIDEHEPPDVELREEDLPPVVAGRGHVRAVSLGRVEDFF